MRKRGHLTIREMVAYHDGELRAWKSARAHLDACERCRKRFDASWLALEAFDDFLFGEPPPLDMKEVEAAFRRGRTKARAAKLGLRVIKGKRR